MEDVTAARGKGGVLSEAAWKKAYQSIEQTVSKEERTGVVSVRSARQSFESSELLEAAYPVFWRKESTDVLKQRTGRVKRPLYITSDDGFYQSERDTASITSATR